MTKDNLIFVMCFSLFLLALCTFGFYTGIVPLCDYLICLFLAVTSSLVAFLIRIEDE
jgi:hypothetical protein